MTADFKPYAFILRDHHMEEGDFYIRYVKAYRKKPILIHSDYPKGHTRPYEAGLEFSYFMSENGTLVRTQHHLITAPSIGEPESMELFNSTHRIIISLERRLK